jgi:hypothetical protein
MQLSVGFILALLILYFLDSYDDAFQVWERFELTRGLFDRVLPIDITHFFHGILSF